MSAYLVQERIEAQRWSNHQATVERDAWIDARAQEIISLFPDEPTRMGCFTLPREALSAMLGDESKEAYNDYVSAIAYIRAEKEWDRLYPTCPF
ncbi:host nuclease inhibitor GamL [Siccibacter colletis]|uniref:Host nuclease inhibitor GamL n=1 Tax=Siccibacter colletis TaxID=1505757 RepID=A0ABY6J971_9ENTR|nr:host nuclease inhibitor GamL [Siccibacter colletis]UYU30319.1 host nuclease inhibitor GamL [Siccibacter colletis]